MEDRARNCAILCTIGVILLTASIVAVVLTVTMLGSKDKESDITVIKVDCGVPSSSVRSHPWHAAIFSSDAPDVLACDATLVGSKWVMTGAECFKKSLDSIEDHNTYPDKVKVILGDYDLNDASEAKSVTMDIEKVFWDDSNYHEFRMGDLAIIKLASSVDWKNNPEIRPACLPSVDFVGEPDELISIGWEQESPGKVIQVSVAVENSTLCQDRLSAAHPGLTIVTEKTFCSSSQDICKPGLGGPVLTMSPMFSSQYTVVGINSWCDTAAASRTFTNVDSMRTWWQPIIEGDLQ